MSSRGGGCPVGLLPEHWLGRLGAVAVLGLLQLAACGGGGSGRTGAAAQEDGGAGDEEATAAVTDASASPQDGSLLPDNAFCDPASCNTTVPCRFGQCVNHVCVVTLLTGPFVYDDDPCTLHRCEDGVCVATPIEGPAECDDNACTSDTCQGGSCVSLPLMTTTTCDNDGAKDAISVAWEFEAVALPVGGLVVVP